MQKFMENPIENIDIYNIFLKVFKDSNWLLGRFFCSKESFLEALENEENKNKLIEFFTTNHHPFKLFCLDPVSGSINNPILGLGQLTDWISPKHFIIPYIVRQCDILYHEDERSLAFDPIFSKPLTVGTTCSYLHIPSFHGIGDGNLFDHNFVKLDLSPEEFDTRFFIQNIVFLKIFQMLHQNGVIFEPSYPSRLNSLLQEALNAVDFDELLLKNYNGLLKIISQDVINFRRKSSYTIANGSDKPRSLIVDVQQTKKSFNELMSFNIHPSRKFINWEHLQLAFKYMLKGYKVFSDHNISIGQILALLNRLVNKMVGGTGWFFYKLRNLS